MTHNTRPLGLRLASVLMSCLLLAAIVAPTAAAAAPCGAVCPAVCTAPAASPCQTPDVYCPVHCPAQQPCETVGDVLLPYGLLAAGTAVAVFCPAATFVAGGVAAAATLAGIMYEVGEAKACQAAACPTPCPPPCAAPCQPIC